jgi:hypothetical protein
MFEIPRENEEHASLIGSMIPQMAGHQKIFLPRQSGQSRFEPQRYYYLASKGGAVPTWVIDEALHNAGAGHRLHG